MFVHKKSMKMIEKIHSQSKVVGYHMQHKNCKPGTEMKHLLTGLRFYHIEFCCDFDKKIDEL